MRLHQTLIPSIATTLLLSAAAAYPQRDNRGANFRDWDRNNDGRLAESEFPGHAGNFRAMDCNRDGSLSRDEFVNRYDCNGRPVAEAPPSDSEFERLDVNDDGVIRESEWRGSTREFDTLDRNNDGRISRSEWTNRGELDSVTARFDAIDRNNDGALSRSELRVDRASFDLMDRNNDGVVSLDEYRREVGSIGNDRGDRDGRFDALDRNDDGVLSRWEWRDTGVGFAEADLDDDSMVSPTEYRRVMGTGTARSGLRPLTYDRFEELDRNRNGLISRGEWRDEAALFELVDHNRDGSIQLTEVRDRSALAGRFNQLDRDRNGYLTRSEWNTGNTFARVDRNSDGRLSRDEFLRVL
jgi:Ca2+-binding EF-hand superfamily protein